MAARDSDDAALLRRYRRGDVAAFELLYQRHRAGLYRFLCGLCGDPVLADEVYQDTWLSLIRSQSEQHGPVLFKTWLYQIARNRLIDHWRRHGRRVREDAYEEAVHDSADPAAGPEQQLELSQDRECLQAALLELPIEQREVFLLRAQGELELDEIARLTLSPAETVKSRLRYAIQKLRRLLVEPAAPEEARR